MNYKSKVLYGGIEFQISSFYKFVKRTLDIVISLFLLVFIVPITIIICLIVRIESEGNPIYKQKRVGLKGKEFNIYKIRSMVNNAEANGAKWADKNDSRVTRVGNFIRKTRLDELPQFVNILKGDMTIIGPRPERKFFYDEFKKDIPNFGDRVAIKPGLTGYAQVNGGYDITPKEKLELDLYYIKHMSFRLDFKILFKTVFIVFSGDGAR